MQFADIEQPPEYALLQFEHVPEPEEVMLFQFSDFGEQDEEKQETDVESRESAEGNADTESTKE
jgi:hypothetical protein